jgi:methionine synthase I (cobalamin-dependent)/5,10-methylenetetrahydrofolate reductase
METTLKPNRAQEFRAALAERPILAGGALATTLFARRPDWHGAVEDANLTLPALVRDIHRDFLAAGAQILKTNTFGGNRIRLAAAGSRHTVAQVNRAGVRIAREAARDRAFVAGVIGPLGVLLQPLGSLPPAECGAVFREQAEALLAAGADLFMLETFRDLAELRVAVEAVREAAGDEIVVAAQVTVGPDGRLYDGSPVESFGPRLDQLRADAIGVNCAGPRAVLETLEALAALTPKPLVAVPSAGLPMSHNGHATFPCPPEYLAAQARRCVEAGAMIVGGCCGVTPEHIRHMNLALAGARPRERSVRVAAPPAAQLAEPLPQAEKSRLGARLAAREFVVIVELPAPRGDLRGSIEAAIQCRQAGADAVSVPAGNRSAHIAPPVAAPVLHARAGIGTLQYVVCRNRTVASLQAELLGANAMGVHNILCITGDPPGSLEIDSIGLVRIAQGLNRGLDFGGNPIGAPAAFLIGVGVNPAAADLDLEIRRLEAKVEAGAEYAITTPVFDAALLEAFLRRIERLGIPVIASVWPMAAVRDAEFAANELGLAVPEAFLDRLRAGEDGFAIAREIAAAVRPMVAGLRVVADHDVARALTVLPER